MDTIETIRVVSPVSEENPNGYIVINKSDLTDAHEVWADAAADEAVSGKRARRSAGE